jgi:DNA-binding NarL/FixJ family response regulator
MVFRAGLRALLENESSFVVVGEFARPEPALVALRRDRPDLVLFGVDRVDTDPAAVLSWLIDAAPAANLVVLSDIDDRDLMREFLIRGARAHLPKSVSFLDLMSVLYVVTAGRGAVALSPHAPEPDRPPVTLSKRECEVIALVAQAMSNWQVARSLDITEGTVKRHLRSVFAKLNAVSRIDAVNKAVAAAIIPPPTDTVRVRHVPAVRAG